MPFVNRVVKAPVIMQIKQVTKHDAIPQNRHMNKERQCPSINQVIKHVVTPPPVSMPRQVPQVQTVAQMAVVPHEGRICSHAQG